MPWKAATLAALAVLVAGPVLAQSIVPNSAKPGREQEQIMGKPLMVGPQIELRDGRPAPVFEVEKGRRKPTRRKCGSARRC